MNIFLANCKCGNEQHIQTEDMHKKIRTEDEIDGDENENKFSNLTCFLCNRPIDTRKKVDGGQVFELTIEEPQPKINPLGILALRDL